VHGHIANESGECRFRWTSKYSQPELQMHLTCKCNYSKYCRLIPLVKTDSKSSAEALTINWFLPSVRLGH